MWIRTPGFAVRLALATTLLVLAAGLVQGIVVARHAGEDLRRELRTSGREAATSLAEMAAPALARDDVEGLARLVEQQRVLPDVVGVRILDAHGLLVAASGAPLIDADPAWTFAAPVAAPPPEQAALGIVEIGISPAPLAALRERIVVAAASGTAACAILGLLGAALLSRAFTRPLRLLAGAADAVARGDLAVRVGLARRDEIGRLAAAFDAMTESLVCSRRAQDAQLRQLEEASRLKSEFLATVSHELRTPINVILGYVEMLADETAAVLTAVQAERLGAIRHYALQQLELVASVLDFARLTSGRATVRLEVVAVAAVLEDVQRTVAARLHPDVVLAVSTDPRLGPWHTDRVKVRVVLRNLVENAIKFTTAGRVCVEARPAVTPGCVLLEVRDTGPGIPPDELPTVFEPFRQLGDERTRVTGGVGLGLSIVREVVTVLGGTVAAESTPGRGTTFRVELPGLQVPVADAAAPSGASIAPRRA